MLGSSTEGSPWTLLALVGTVLVGVAILGLEQVVTIVAVALAALFVAYFLRHLAFSMAALRVPLAAQSPPLHETGYCPSVTVLVACKNEEAVADRLVETLLELDYPEDRLQIVVVDDGSDDATGEILDRHAAVDARLRCVHRAGGGGGKSGALNTGFEVATGEVIIVFDADHRPRADVARRLVRHFEDPMVGAVQGRCEIGNPADSPLSRLIAIDYMSGYLVSEYGRQALYQLPAYGGANCAVRAADLRTLGGWNPDTVTEDTDLTLRLVLSGRRVRYDVSAVDVEEGVVTMARYWRQRYRWARGHQKVWRDYRRSVVRSPRLRPTEKVETIMFLLMFHMPVASAVGLGILALWFAGIVHPVEPLNSFVLWTLLFLGPLLELGGGLLIARAPRREALALIWFLPLFLTSVALCTKAWIDGQLGRPYTWVKTKRAKDVAPVVISS